MNIVYSLEELKNILNPVFMANPVFQAILFGSYAKGLATDKSDIDIVIDSKGELLNINFYGLLEEITNRLNKNVDLFEISEIKKNSSIYKTIQQEGVLLYAK
jgi:predicted nucleotidyltransferase